MDWISDPASVMWVLIGLMFVIGVHFDLHLRHISALLNEIKDSLGH